ncbi:hypothetical protein HPB52_025487 [Rhipicephalus sanguineus]|uniref:Uncharacterized protein n=1 Tax=Rhipicephalus sanguineus TaxID=34632 RepID=A0A9D4TCZ9_RHISA|nr:hypothetical protein HPB52_025487 [Rhipicephalus sanguineus]
MSVTCLIHRGPSSYVLTVAGSHKMEDLKAAMAAHSSLHSVDTNNAILQVDNKRFNTFVNIDENTTLDDSSVIRILDVCILGDGNAVEVDEDLCLVKAMPIRNCYTQQIIRRRLQPSS